MGAWPKQRRMRAGLLLCAILLPAGCGDPGAATRDALADADARAAEDGRIECAVDGASALERVCTLEWLSGGEAPTLVIRHPDGGFRRLVVTTDGRGVAAADGAEPAIVSVVADNRIVVAIGQDRYRLPATLMGR